VTGKPTAYPPSAHTHSWGDVTDKPAAFPPSGHAGSHASGGSDPVTPASIGAVASGDVRLRDTGWRDVSGYLASGVTVSTNLGHAHIRRIGSTVMFRFKVDVTAVGVSSLVQNIPDEFRTGVYELLPPPATASS